MGLITLFTLLVLLNFLRTQTLKLFLQAAVALHIPATCAVWIYAILYLPGTVIHELSHFIVSILLGLRTGDIELLPTITNNGIKFGSVAIENRDPFSSFLVGIAPTFVCITLLQVITTVYFKQEWNFLIALAYIYFIITIGSHLIPSKEDLVYLIPSALLFGITSSLWWYLHPNSFETAVAYVNSQAQLLHRPTLLSILSILIINLIAVIIVTVSRKKTIQ